jgi:lipopolysaccharide/colanic/teichoic acid biosynthesis glycosyltransferase
MSVYSSSTRRAIVVGPPFSRVSRVDRVASVAMLAALLPVLVCVSLAVWASGERRILDPMPCLGPRGRRCLVWSFCASRGTRLGRLLRAHGVHRIPVLLSVLHGTVTLREALELEPIS